MKSFLLRNWMAAVVLVAFVAMAGPSLSKHVAAKVTHKACPACQSSNTTSKLWPSIYMDTIGGWDWLITCHDCDALSTTGGTPPTDEAERDAIIKAAFARADKIKAERAAQAAESVTDIK